MVTASRRSTCTGSTTGSCARGTNPSPTRSPRTRTSQRTTAYSPLESVGEPPARGSVRLFGCHAESGRWRHRVEVPRRRPGARRAVLVRKRAILDVRWPAAIGVALGEPLERLVIGHALDDPLDDEVHA